MNLTPPLPKVLRPRANEAIPSPERELYLLEAMGRYIGAMLAPLGRKADATEGASSCLRYPILNHILRWLHDCVLWLPQRRSSATVAGDSLRLQLLC